MKCKSIELQKNWNELQSIFSNYTKFTSVIERKLNKIGISAVKNGKHIKLIFTVAENKSCVTISSTPSDNYAGNQILRVIRRLYDEN